MRALLLCRLFRLSAGLVATGLSAQVGAQIVLYEHEDYNGRSYRSFGEERNLDRVHFNDEVSSIIVRSGIWQLCSDTEFNGRCITLKPGSYRSMNDMGMNDRISSIRPLGSGSQNNHTPDGGGGGKAAVQLFEHENYGGRKLISNGSPDLSQQGFNDRASSVLIRSGRWEFCVDNDYRGRCVTLGPGSYGQLNAMGLNDEVSSFRAAGGASAHDHDGPRSNSGGSTGADGSAPEVHLNGNRSGRVTYASGCVVYYNASGQRYKQEASCNKLQIGRADQAMAAHRREQGI